MNLLLRGLRFRKKLSEDELEDAIEMEIRRQVFQEEDKMHRARKHMLARQLNLEALRKISDLPNSDIDKIDAQVRQTFQQRVNAGEDLEELIGKEVSSRVFQEENVRQTARKKKLNQQDHSEALREISDLPDSKVKEIEKKVREKFRKRNETRLKRQADWARKRKIARRWALPLAVVGALGVVGVNFFYFGPPDYPVHPGYNPITYAAANAKIKTLQDMLDRNMDINAKDSLGLTAVMRAGEGRNGTFFDKDRNATLRFLLEKGANVDLTDPDGRTALFKAVVNLDDDVVKILLVSGANPNIKNAQGNTPLLKLMQLQKSSVGRYRPVLTELLLAHGADVNIKDNQGRTAMNIARQNKLRKIIRYMVPHLAGKQHREELAQRNIRFDVNSFHTRVKKNDLHSVQLFLAGGMEVDAKKAKGFMLETALMEAANSGHLEMMRLLIENGADVNFVQKGRGTALTKAASDGYTEIVKLLLAEGARVESLGSNGATALIEAAAGSHTAIIKALVDKGANINAHDNNGYTPLISATSKAGRSSSESIIQTITFLLANGADVNARNNDGRTALLETKRNNTSAAKKAKVIQLLLESGADLNAENANSIMDYVIRQGDLILVTKLLKKGADLNSSVHVPLLQAAAKGKTEIVKLLLSKGAKTGLKDRRGRTALMLAANYVHLASVKVLVRKGAKVNTQDKRGKTALIYAASIRGNTQIVTFLLKKGAKVDTPDEYGETALMWAKRHGNHKVEKLLTAKGAK